MFRTGEDGASAERPIMHRRLRTRFGHVGRRGAEQAVDQRYRQLVGELRIELSVGRPMDL